MNTRELGSFVVEGAMTKSLDSEKQIEVIDEATQRVYLVDRATVDSSGRLVLIVKEAAL